MEKQWLFSYGTLQDSEIQKSLFGYICPQKKAILTGWSLYSAHENGYLFVKPEASGVVTGSILEVNTNALHSADQWEEIPFYRREKVLVTLEDDTTQEVWAYTRRDADGNAFEGNELSINEREFVLTAVDSLVKQKERITLPICDVYIMIPCTISNESNLLLNQSVEDFANDSFLQSFIDVANIEFSGYLASELKRKFLSEIEIITFSYSNNGLKQEVGRQRINSYLTSHKKTKLAVITLVIPVCSVSPHDLLDHMTRDDICLSEISGSTEIITMAEWLTGQGLKQSGTPRAAVILSGEPTHADLHALLAAEADPVDEIISPEIKSIAANNISQYKYYKMYVSETCEVEIPTPFGATYEDRVFDAILTLFIIELLLFQDASLTLVQSQVEKEITRSKYKSNSDGLSIIEDLGTTFANAMLFWNVRNFRYRTAQNLADSFANAFGIERLRRNYAANRDLLEQLVHVHSARMAEKENRIITVLLVILTTLQVLPTLFIAILAMLDGKVTIHQLYASGFSLCTCAIIWLIFLSRRNRKRIDEVINWLPLSKK